MSIETTIREIYVYIMKSDKATFGIKFNNTTLIDDLELFIYRENNIDQEQVIKDKLTYFK